MLDDFGRTIDYLRLSVTDRCNCRCVYCMPATGVPKHDHADMMSFEELVRCVEAAAHLGIHKVRLTGGEPLVRAGIVDLVGMVAAVPGITEVAMTTNATLLAPVAAQLKAAGLTRVNISLDTLDPECYHKMSRTDKLEDALAGLAAAQAAGLTPIKINCVLAAGLNQDDWFSVAQLAQSHPYTVRFIELMRMGECVGWPESRFVSADAFLSEFAAHLAEKNQTLEPLRTEGVAELYQPSGWQGRVGVIRPVSHKFCGSCNRLRITPDGKLKACLHSAAEVDLRHKSQEELEVLLARAIAHKPQQHNLGTALDAHSETARSMFEIGG